MQLCSDYQTAANDYSNSGNGTLSTFAQLKKYLRENYECKMSAYQLYQKFDSLSSRYADLAGVLGLKGFVLCTE